MTSIANLPIRQRPQLKVFRDKWSVRDERGGPFGPGDLSQEAAEAWISDPLPVTVVAVLQDHHESIHYNDWGTRRCTCGADQPSNAHIADVVAARLRLAGLAE